MIEQHLNKVYNMDCLEFMKTLPDGCIDLTVTSPPYDNLRDYKGYTFDFEGIAKELYRVTKKGGVVVWVVGDSTVNGSESGTSFRQALYFKEIGFNLHDTMLYHKKNYIPLTHNRYEQCFEYMFIFSKEKVNTFNGMKIKTLGITGGAGNMYNKDGTKRRLNSPRGVKNQKLLTNIWTYPTGQERNGHPAVFPSKLAIDHILSWSNEGDTVMDPFAGSGTTLVASKQLKRNYIGTEISQEYVDIINKRLENSPNSLF